jgi:hypothetical protein
MANGDGSLRIVFNGEIYNYRGLRQELEKMGFIHPAMGMGALVGPFYIVTQWFDIEANASLIFGGLAFEILYIGIVNLLVVAAERLGRTSGSDAWAASHEVATNC